MKNPLSPTTDPDATLPDPVLTPGSPHPSTIRIDRFELGVLIGQGGMGRVWEARDPRLGRPVAIKHLHVPDPQARRRFLREARLQAALAHPGICPVFEVGQADGMPFIVMPRLHGQPLDQATEGLALEPKLVLVQQVAEAVHAAHRQGLVHRDLKPSNILVESPEDGPPRPVVLDFGIARPVAGDRPPASESRAEGTADIELTATGQVIGTPAYMAPEQVRGETDQLDRRTDVYALGATLYRLLTGHPPHEGKGGTLMVRILRDEPPRLRPTGIPADVEAIVFRCLEKQKEKRYDSALALAEDLDRYLRGQPVRARRISGWVRLGKWLGRHRAAAAVAAVASLLLLAALGWGAWSAHRAEERERLARRFGAQVEEVEALVRYSHLVPLHDVRRDRSELRRLLDSITANLDDPDPVVRALAHHALGRGRLALDDPETAREHLETARELDPTLHEAAIDLGRALSELYRDELATLERLGDRAGRDSLRAQLRQRLDATFSGSIEEKKQLERTLGQPARNLLAPHPDSAQPFADRDDALPLEVLSLFHQGRPEAALDRLAQAPPGPSWDYERLRLEGDIRRSWAVSLQAETDDGAPQAREQLELARRAYADALVIAESNAALLRDDAQAVALLVRLGLVAPEEVEPLVDEALRSLRQARLVDPESARTWLWIARLELVAANHATDRARNPSAPLEAARRAAEHALELDPDASDAAYELGRTHWQLARWANEQGLDPDLHFDAAEKAFARVAPEDRDYAYFTSVGSLRLSMAGRRAELGLDATDAYEAATDAYRAAAERHSAPFAALSNLGLALLGSADLEGTSPRQVLGRAIRTFEQARDLDPDHMVPHYYLGIAHLRLAQDGNRASATLDGALAEKAADALARSAELAPERFQPQVGLGELFHLRALDAHARGQDPAPHFARAREAHEKALELAPDQPVALLNLAWTAYFEAKFALRDGRDADGPLEEAAGLCARSLELREHTGSLLCLGSVRRLQAEAESEADDRQTALIDEAAKYFEKILELDPGHAEAHRSLGRLFTLDARRLRLSGTDPSPALQRARRALDQALELENEVIFFHLADARWHLERMESLAPEEDSDGRWTSSAEAARRRLDKARERLPESAELARLQTHLDELSRRRRPAR